MKEFFRGRLFKVLLLIGFFILGNYSQVLASTELPTFPTCSSKLGVSGDWSHSDNGTQYIVGVGNREGKDDVYQLPQGNFLQCFCPGNGTNGIQTNWWNITRSPINSEETNTFKNQGWMELSGQDYNLYHESYLAKNYEFSCSVPSPTVTTSLTPTPTNMPTGLQSRCYDLEAIPLEGVAPLTVKFTAHADDPVSGGKIKEYRFDFGDASGGQPQVWHQTDRIATHRYEKSGEYEANLRVQDGAGNWRESDDCKVKIKVTDSPQVLGTNTASELPVTGISALNFLILTLGFGLAGIYLYKRFKLI